MFTEGAIQVELHRGSKVVSLEIQAERALVGSGAHCDVRLAPDEAAIEQLSIETLDEEVYVRVLAVNRPCLLNGAPFLEGRVGPSALLELGGVLLRARFMPRQAQAAKQGRQSVTPPAVQALALAGLALGFYYVLSRPARSAEGSDAVPSPPSLAASAEPCPHTDPEAARSRAEEARIAAENKRERAPFYPSDGREAVQLFARAASCYERANDAAASQDARAAADQLSRQLADELHVRHVRLERLFLEQKYAEVKREGQLMGEFIADPAHPYSQWLSAVIREGELQTRKEEKR